MKTAERSKEEHSQLFTKDFSILAIGQFISLFGNTLQRFALSLYILDVTGSAALFSVLLSLTIIPQIILSPFGGAIADRNNKRNIMVLLDMSSGILLLIFAVIVSRNPSSTVVIGVLMCTLAIIQSIYEPAVRASLPIIIKKDNLTDANSLVSGISALTSLLGPIAAGFLYGIYGIEVIFIINILSFIISAIMEIFLYIPHVKSVMENSAVKTFASDIKESLIYLIKEKRGIFYMILLAAGLNLFLTPIYTVGVPYVEKIIFGISDQLYGISEGVIGMGMICGAILTTKLSKILPVNKLHILFIAIAVLILAMGGTTLPWAIQFESSHLVVYSIFTLIGFLFSIIIMSLNIIAITFMQVETPPSMMGKVMSLVTSLSTALMPIGQIIFGVLYDKLTNYIFIIYLLSSIITVALVCVLIKSKVYKELGHE